VVIFITRYVERTEPIYFEVAGGKAGVPIFYTVEDAQEFAEAYWELLGPGLEALEIPDQEMAQLLRKCASKTKYVIHKPRPVWEPGDLVWWEMVDICQFAEGLSERDW
jgi:hypothetical protein